MKKPDHKFYAEISTDKITVKRVLCEVYLPEKRDGKIGVKLFLTKKQAGKLSSFFEFSLKGKIKGFSGKIENVINADKIYKLKSNQLHWGPNLIDKTVVVCKPIDLKITRLFAHDREEAVKDKIVFWISHSSFLSPLEWIEQSYTGNVNVKTSDKVRVKLENNIPLAFRNSYNYYKNPEGEDVTYTDLVAETTSRKKLFDENEIGGEIIKCLDDFLILVSFAERRRVACIGWEFRNAKGYTRFYRRNVVISKPKKNRSDIDGLIDISTFKDFIRKTYKNFCKIEQIDLIRQAMQYVVGSFDATVESSFKTLFAALETLLLSFRINCNLETILPPDKWTSFERDLKKWIKTHGLLADNESKEKRRLIYEKVPGLNKISFSNVFKSLCEYYKIDLSDLWPMTDNSKGSSLTEIRNRLVHGEHFDLGQLNSMVVAGEHLRWTVERILLSILGWPISYSYVSEAFLSNVLVFNKNWENHRKILSS